MFNSASPSSDFYLNMQQFSELKTQARQNSPEAAKAAAQQFEGLFIQMMLKEMRAAATFDESQHSSNMDFYNEMYDKQLALDMARAGGIGLAETLNRQLGGEDAKRQAPAAAEGMSLPTYRMAPRAAAAPALSVAQMNYQSENPEVKAHPVQFADTHVAAEQAAVLTRVESLNRQFAVAALKVSEGAVSEAAVSEAGTTSATQSSGIHSEFIKPFEGWQSPQSFVADLWPHAEKAANALGISPQLLVAQSALETGWGQHAMRGADGNIAFNLFGIKAGSGWAGRSVSHNTLEFSQGVMQQERAQFRAYDSVADSLQDYVDFVQSRSRYQDALDHGGSDERYIRGLHQAGYATDPRYADKILSIIQGDTFKQALAQLPSHSGPSSEFELGDRHA